MEGDGEKGKREKIKHVDGNIEKKKKKEKLVLSEEAMKKCLEERKGQNSAMVTCESIVEAFNKSSSSSLAEKKPLTPLRLRSGCLTDV